MNGKVVPVILCGGGGMRLWPASTAGRPKPFLPLVGGDSTFALTLARVADADLFARPLIIANRGHREAVAEALAASGAEATLMLEPEGRDTAPAIAAAVNLVAESAPGALVLVLAADHLVRDVAGFRATVRAALPAAEAGRIVVFGIPPTSPHTGFGYIRRGAPLGEDVSSVAAFVEKPDAATAGRYIDAGYLWNSGNFLMTAAGGGAEIRRHAPDVMAAADAAVAGAARDGGVVELEPGAFAKAPRISIDHAVMEKTAAAAVIEAAFDWSDLGTWSSVWDAAEKDQRGNAVDGPVGLLDVADSYASSDGPVIGMLGVDGLVVVARANAVLVARRDRSDSLKDLVKLLPSDRRRTPEGVPHVEVLDTGPHHAVARLTLAPGERLESDAFGGSATWVIVAGSMEAVGRDGDVVLLEAGAALATTPGEPRTLVNGGAGPATLVTVARQ